MNEDIKPLEEEEGGDNDEDEEDGETGAWTGFGDDPSGVQAEEGDEDEGNDEIAWGDVFAEDGLNKADADGEASGASELEEEENEEDSPEQEAVSGSEEDDPRRKRNAKEPRMTTNKVFTSTLL